MYRLVGNRSIILLTKGIMAKGKANEAVVRVLSDYFNVPKSHVRILKGTQGKQKIVEII